MPIVTIYTDTWGDDKIPHTFLGITDDNGNTIYRGFSPDKTGLWGVGSVKDDFGHESQHSYALEITQEQYDKLIANIDKSSQDKIFYNLLLGAQCTVWAMDMLYSSGIIESIGPFEPNIDPMRDYSVFSGIIQTLIMNPYTQRFGYLIDDLLSINSALDFWKDLLKDLTDSLSNNLDDISTLLDDLPPILELLGISTNEDFRSPLVLDLNNDRITSLNLDESSVYFDLDNNNFKEQTAWISPNDGLLVFDRNSNGTIDNGSELFGNFTPISNTDSSFALQTQNDKVLAKKWL